MATRSANHYRYKITISVLVAAIFLLSRCVEADNKDQSTVQEKNSDSIHRVVEAPTYTAYAGSASCAKCHADVCMGYDHTAHALTSQAASSKFILGSFAAGKNTFAFSNGETIVMEKKADSFYQSLYYEGKEQLKEPFDVVVGSGVMGQSFLYWKNKSLFQLPVTYFSAAKEWSNSPGFPNHAVYNRVITSRCMECHSTFVGLDATNEKEVEQFNRSQIIYGITCEKCHGPAARHVAFQTQNPGDTSGQFILNPAKVSRQQKLDLCALCHSGRLQKTQPSFAFQSGDTLAGFFKIATEVPDPNNIDVHGNQYGLLRSSECFLKSQDMTCGTCHNTHKNERGKTLLFSERCMTCHSPEHNNFCKLADELGSVIKTNCIDCHMPLNPSRAIAVFLPGKDEATAALVRSHYITIYPEETKKILTYMKKKK